MACPLTWSLPRKELRLAAFLHLPLRPQHHGHSGACTRSPGSGSLIPWLLITTGCPSSSHHAVSILISFCVPLALFFADALCPQTQFQ